MKLKIIFILIFISSIFIANSVIFKFDKYEKSTDNKSNHSLIKGDVHKFWVEADKIKKIFKMINQFMILVEFFGILIFHQNLLLFFI